VLLSAACAPSTPARAPARDLSRSCRTYAETVCAQSGRPVDTCAPPVASQCESYCAAYADGSCRALAHCGAPSEACLADQTATCARHPDAFDVLNASCK
jgi:hypothetical protein